MSAEHLQEISNWITGIGVFVNTGLTIAIIWLTKTTAVANKRSAKASEYSAIAATRTYELSKEMLDNQKSKEQKMREEYRRFYGKKIVDYSIGCANAMMSAFNQNPTLRDHSRMHLQPDELDFEQDQLFLYFDMKDIDQLFNSVRDFSEIKKSFMQLGGYTQYDWDRAAAKTSSLISDFQVLIRTFDIR